MEILPCECRQQIRQHLAPGLLTEDQVALAETSGHIFTMARDYQKVSILYIGMNTQLTVTKFL